MGANRGEGGRRCVKKQPELADASDYLNDERLTNTVIDCLGGMEVISVICQTVFSGACKAAKRVRGSGTPKMTYIYCSGMIHYQTILNPFPHTLM